MEKCEHCNSPTTLDLSIGKWVCVYCGREFPIEYLTYGLELEEREEED